MGIFGFESTVILIALIIGSVFDIKSREIPDILSFCLVGFAMFYGLVASIILSDYFILLSKLIGFIIAGIIGLALYFLGQWGGGDAKIIMGIGAMIGIDLFGFDAGFGSVGVPSLAIFLLNTIFMGAIYGFFWLFFISFVRFNEFRKEFRSVRRAPVYTKIRKYVLLGCALFVLVILFINIPETFKILLILFAFFAVLAFYSSMFVKSVENGILIKRISVGKLTEGDWVVGKVRLPNGRFFKPARTGITRQDIETLKKSGIRNVVVKEGIPFVPSFLLAYIVTVAIGNWPVIITGLL